MILNLLNKMRVKCLYKTGADLRPFESKPLMKEDQLGRFGVTGVSVYEELSIGKEYIVMGIIIFENYQAYLIDDGLISACPCQLFEVTDSKINSNWRVRLVEKEEDIYPYMQLLMGYPEFCSDKNAYEKLIIEKQEEAQRIYFRRKAELELESLNNL